MNGPHDAAFAVAKALDLAGIAYAFMGGLATQALAIPTATFDVDLTIAEVDADRALQVLANAGFEIPPEHAKGFRDHLQGMGKIRVVRPGPPRPIDVDLFIVTTPFQATSFGRRQKARLAGREVWVLTAEDIVLYKLLAWRPKDRSAIQNLLIANPAADRAHLNEWAMRLGVADRLREALVEVDRFWN